MSRLLIPVTAVLSVLAACSAPNARVVTRLNQEASLAGDLPADPLQWKVITSGVDARNGTMFTLFGNDRAVQYVRTPAAQSYPAGSVLSLVTWRQQEDGRWFGGKIPAQAKSAEFVEVRDAADGRVSYIYRDYEGSPLKEVSVGSAMADARAAYLVSQRASVMP